MKFPAGSSGVSIGNHLNRPKGRGIKPLSASGGLKNARENLIKDFSAGKVSYPESYLWPNNPSLGFHDFSVYVCSDYPRTDKRCLCRENALRPISALHYTVGHPGLQHAGPLGMG